MAADPMAAPAGLDVNDPQNSLILSQFAKQKAALNQQKMAAEEQSQMGVDRQQAITGMSGGTALKAASNARSKLENDFATQDETLGAQQAQSLAGVAATKQAQQYGTQERLGTQQFAGQQATQAQQAQSELQKQQLSEQEYQFQNTFGLQSQQFQANQKQFNDQMSYQYNELTENQKTNFINAMTAFQKAGGSLTAPSEALGQLESAVQNAQGNYRYTGQPPAPQFGSISSLPNSVPRGPINNSTNGGVGGYQPGAGYI